MLSLLDTDTKVNIQGYIAEQVSGAISAYDDALYAKLDVSAFNAFKAANGF